MFKVDRATIAAAFPVPAHVKAAAAAVAYDLLHGPAFACVPSEGIESFTEDHFATFAEDLAECDGEISEVYSGPVAQALREFIEELPSEIYCDESGYYIGDSEPEGELIESEDEEGEPEWVEPEPYYALSGREVVSELFGSVIAREFH